MTFAVIFLMIHKISNYKVTVATGGQIVPAVLDAGLSR